MARIPRVENFLFCYPLRSGIIFLASLSVVLNVLQLLGLAFMYDSISGAERRSYSYESAGTKTSITYANSQSSGFDRAAGQALGTGLAVITINVLLIIGVVYKKPGLFLPWLGISGISIVLLALGLVGVTILLPIYQPFYPALTAGAFFLILIVIGCYLHVFCVVHTYYKQLQNPMENDMKLIERDPVKIPYTNVA